MTRLLRTRAVQVQSAPGPFRRSPLFPRAGAFFTIPGAEQVLFFAKTEQVDVAVAAS